LQKLFQSIAVLAIILASGCVTTSGFFSPPIPELKPGEKAGAIEFEITPSNSNAEVVWKDKDREIFSNWFSKEGVNIAIRVSWYETASFERLNQYLDIAHWLMSKGWNPHKSPYLSGEYQTKIKVYLDEPGRAGREETVIYQISKKAEEEKLRIPLLPTEKSFREVKKTLQKIMKISSKTP
jgi:hypothetical protein